MAIFRVERTKDYTVMSNHHLRNPELSLKAKGLLSQMLSLPEAWNYTLRGLVKINRESIDAIRAAVLELEKAGYITRWQGRDDKGKMTNIVYTIYEQPQKYTPCLDFPITADPCSGFPNTDKPTSDNPTELNKEVLKKDLLNTDLSNTYPIQSEKTTAKPPDGNGTEQIRAIETYREIIMDNIEYEIMARRYDKARLDEIVELMLETVCTARQTIRIAGDDYPAELVKSKLLKLTDQHIDYVFESMKENTTKIRNIKKYMLAVLFNAPSTIDNYYTALVNHDLYGGG